MHLSRRHAAAALWALPLQWCQHSAVCCHHHIYRHQGKHIWCSEDSVRFMVWRAGEPEPDLFELNRWSGLRFAKIHVLNRWFGSGFLKRP